MHRHPLDHGVAVRIRGVVEAVEEQALRLADVSAVTGRAIEKIPPKYRPSFVLREIDKLSYEEIAATTGLKLGTVRSRINRGRKYFRKAIAPLLADDYRLKGNES